jgi:hypothetical protein
LAILVEDLTLDYGAAVIDCVLAHLIANVGTIAKQFDVTPRIARASLRTRPAGGNGWEPLSRARNLLKASEASQILSQR